MRGTNTGTDGVVKPGTFGENPNGRVVSLSNGQYFTVNTRADLPKFASGNRTVGTEEANTSILQGSLASYGAFRISADGKELIMKAIGSTWQPWVGVKQSRVISINEDQMPYKLSSTFSGVIE